MKTVYNNGWKINYDSLSVYSIEYFIDKLKNIERNDEKRDQVFKHKSFKYFYRSDKNLPFLHDSINNVNYLSLGFVYVEGSNNISMHRIEERNSKFYIYIADQKLKTLLKERQKNNLKATIYNTSLLKYIIAGSLHLDDKLKLLLNYDDNNSFLQGIMPYDVNFIMDVIIENKLKTFHEKISFGNELIDTDMVYNELKIKSIQFNNKECYGIIQGGEDHRFLYNLSMSYNGYSYKK